MSIYYFFILFQSKSINSLKFFSFVFFCTENQSIIVKIPQQPPVRSFKTPIPVSLSINLSTPRPPKKSEIRRIVVGSLSSMHESIENLVSSILLSFSFKNIIFSAGKYFWLVIINISTFCLSTNTFSSIVVLLFKYTNTGYFDYTKMV